MENLNLPPFYVGQRIVAVKNHSQGLYKKGDEFIVMGLKPACCEWHVDIGFVSSSPVLECTSCGRLIRQQKIRYTGCSMFAPIQEQKFPLIKLTKVIEKEKQLMSAN